MNEAANAELNEIRPAVDWAAVEADYCANDQTVREIAAKHGCSPGRVSQVAKARGWPPRSLNASGTEPTEDSAVVTAVVTTEEVAAEVAKPEGGASPVANAVANAVATARPFDRSIVDIPERTRATLSRPVREQLARISNGEIDALYAAELNPLLGRLDAANADHAKAAAVAARARDDLDHTRSRIPAAEALVNSLEAERPHRQARFALGRASTEELAAGENALQLARQAVEALRGALQPLEDVAKHAQRPVVGAADRTFEAEQALRNARADCAIRLAESRTC